MHCCTYHTVTTRLCPIEFELIGTSEKTCNSSKICISSENLRKLPKRIGSLLSPEIRSILHHNFVGNEKRDRNDVADFLISRVPCWCSWHASPCICRSTCNKYQARARKRIYLLLLLLARYVCTKALNIAYRVDVATDWQGSEKISSFIYVVTLDVCSVI